MPDIPAICEDCGAPFYSGLAIRESQGVVLSGGTSECPRCGGRGQVPSGTFNFLNETIEVLKGSDLSVQELRGLGAIVRDLRERGADAEEVRETIRREAPPLATLADRLPDQRIAAWIAAVLSALTLMLQMRGADDDGPDRVTNQPTYNITVEAPENNNRGRRVYRVGRNDPCPCGSGMKYKRCHGNPAKGHP